METLPDSLFRNKPLARRRQTRPKHPSTVKRFPRGENTYSRYSPSIAIPPSPSLRHGRIFGGSPSIFLGGSNAQKNNGSGQRAHLYAAKTGKARGI